MRMDQLPTPCYVVDEDRLEENLKILAGVMEETGCRILLAQKAFSAYGLYPLIGKYLNGTTASGLFEARLGRQEMALHPEFRGRNLETHVFSAAYREDEFQEIAGLCDHVVFNSFAQLEKFRDTARKMGAGIGLRINPECSTQEGHAIYDPCSHGSRLGITADQFSEEKLSGVEGLHFHTLCEQDADDLERTLDAVEEKFGRYLSLPQMKWLNFGGGHHITRKDYQIPLLIRCIRRIKERYGLQVYLEPGEAVALNAGYLLTKVLDVVENGGVSIAILDTSAACHMPDVLEMPYRPPLKDSGMPGEKAYTFRLAGPTCLAGDVIGDYSFDEPLKVGQELVFQDMAIYSMVKNNTFNGMPLPAIAFMRQGQCRIWKQFGYENFKCRL
ncbi:MAG TPA: carboxynorspermidine decarboxylase [Candidatus Caccovicinus merdipullorum]|uniref:Carboxynorspermidine decarboxylase n=1 Tax=Candidatus Caccovicinus merdipullorum TaxID=2840724 RepID=A0A9D1GHQ5_9FIRM|nr:carboxynorspermidine decarboxylase [Candidatus Caccovicinus merdipullorum]